MIQHALASQDGVILPILQTDLAIDAIHGQWLCEFGAIYHNHQRVRSAEVAVKKGDYLRVHSLPRRFPVAQIDWKSCVIAETADFVVINKPFGVPTHATVDNLFENAAHQTSLALQTATHVTHRLDVATSGVLFLAKTKEMQKAFNLALKNGRVEKTYLAKVAGSLQQTGIVEHYMESSNYLPKRVSKTPVEAWQQCLLEILQVQFDARDNTSQVDIRLITGRTHQIRAQMAELGHPIIGDKIYGGQDPWDKIEQIELRARSLKFQVDSCEHFYSLKD